MPTQNHSWIEQLERLIQQKHMLKTSFYQAWTRGELSKATLQVYAKEYYQHVVAFPQYLSALHSRCEDRAARRNLLENLMDEEAGNPNHLDLWRNFALALGTDAEELDTLQARPATQKLIDTFFDICRTQPLAVGVAALYCYESQIPAICPTKIDGLKKWYGMNDPEGYRYFTVHETADVEHAQTEKQMLLRLVQPGEEEAVLIGAEKILTALEDFLGSFDTCCKCA